MANQYGIESGQQLQSGWESSLGGGGAATFRHRGVGTWEDRKKIVFPKENVGYVSGLTRTYIPMYLAAINQEAVEATYEEIGHVLACAIKNVVSGSADGAGSGKIYTYTAHSLATTLNTIKTKVFEAGDNHSVGFLKGAFVNGFTLAGKQGEAWMIAADWLAQKVLKTQKQAATIAFVASTKKITDSGSGLAIFATGDRILVEGSTGNDGIYTIATGGVAGEIVTTEALADESAGATVRISKTFTGSLSLIAQEEMLFSNTKLYIDAVGGTIGTTQKSNALLSASLKASPGWRPRAPGGDGYLYYSALRAINPEFLLDVVMEYAGAASAEIKNCDDETPRLIRLRCDGNALATAGTTYTYKTMIIDLAGQWEAFNKVDVQDGNDVITGTFRARYDSTAAKFFEIVIVNELASLA